MTRREIFDRVKTHLLAQGRRATDGTIGPCMYRAPDGARCAVGCLISDEAYRPGFEGLGAETRSVLEALRISGVDATEEETQWMLIELQKMHDGYMPSEWPAQLDELERRFFGGAS